MMSVIASFVAGAILTLVVLGLAKLVRRMIPQRFRPAASPKDDHMQILVLGDIGRSPRMQYHALSIARHGGKVDLIGYKETARHPELIMKPRVGLYPLNRQPEWLEWQMGILALPLKALWNSFVLFHTLVYATPPARWIIIQNPPSIPTLHVAMLASWLRGTKLMLDWHNYGHSIMALNRSPRNPVVLAYKWYETFFGPRVGHVHLTVTDAMAADLGQKPWKVRAEQAVLTLHDRPASTFQPITSPEERRAFLSSIAQTKAVADSIVQGSMRLVVSSTSWTPDEDFGVLLEALVQYAKPPTDGDDGATEKGSKKKAQSSTPLMVIITGKGPQKEDFEKMVSNLWEGGNLPNVSITTAWLSTREYASLLACADVGVCLHKSSSGVDLPMKIVDMFGSGLPVVAYSGYRSFGELVREGDNGCGFETAQELTSHLRRLFGKGGSKELDMLKKGAIKEGSRRWDDEWDPIVGKTLGLVEA